MKDKTFKEKVILIILTVTIISLIIAAIINYKGIINLIGRLVTVAVPFIYSGCIAYLLTPLCNKIENKLSKKFKKHSETLAVAITEIVFIAILIVVVITVIPQSIKSIANIIETAPDTWETFQSTVQNMSGRDSFISNLIGGDIKEINNIVIDFVNNNIIPHMDEIITSIVGQVTNFGRTILNIIIGIIISIFVLASRKTFAKHTKIILRTLLNKTTYDVVMNEVKIANKMFSGFFIGKIIDSLIVGIICFISLSIMRMPYAVLVSVIVAITNVIPVVGPFIGAIPGTIIIFSASPIKSLYFIIFIIILQQIDGHIIGPKCIGSATGLSTFWVLFAILFFGGLWGIIGMVVGVPLLAVIFDIGKKVIRYIMDKRNISMKDID